MRAKRCRAIKKLVRDMDELLLIEVHNIYGELTKEIDDDHKLYKAGKKTYMWLKRNGKHERIKKLFNGERVKK